MLVFPVIILIKVFSGTNWLGYVDVVGVTDMTRVSASVPEGLKAKNLRR